MKALSTIHTEKELYSYLSDLLGLETKSLEEAKKNAQFLELWNVLYKQCIPQIIYDVIEVSTPWELIGILLVLLDIGAEETETENEVEEKGDLSSESEASLDDEMKQAKQFVRSSIPKLERRQFEILWNMFKRIPKLTFVVENYYVDRIYRDSYYSYFSNKHFETPRYCKRLFAFNGCLLKEKNVGQIHDLAPEVLQERFIGCMVIRPLEYRKIGRSLLNPFYIIDNNKVSDVYLRTAKYTVTMLGIRLAVKAFPYSMQDTETTSCAEITILNMMDYYSRLYVDYRFLLPSDIMSIAIQNDYQRKLPTKGLNYHMISRVFMEDGFSPVLYSASIVETPEKFKRILHTYIESGIPTAVSLAKTEIKKHSIVCIGHGSVNHEKIGLRRYSIANKEGRLWLINTADFFDDYIVMDDNKSPYSVYRWDFKDNVAKFAKMRPEFLMVPLYKRMFLEASDAYDICTSILADNRIGYMAVMKRLKVQRRFVDEEYLNVGKKSNPIIIRLFMASARGFKKQRVEDLRDINRSLMKAYINTPLPRFVWVCELYLESGYPENCCGEVVIDATSSSIDGKNSALIIHYPFMIAKQFVDRKGGINFGYIKDWKCFKGYRQNLCVPESLLNSD